MPASTYSVPSTLKHSAKIRLKWNHPIENCFFHSKSEGKREKNTHYEKEEEIIRNKYEKIIRKKVMGEFPSEMAGVSLSLARFVRKIRCQKTMANVESKIVTSAKRK